MRPPTDESKSDELLRIDKEQSAYYQGVFERFDGHCVVCYPQDPYPMGVTVHELHSKAQYPKDWWSSVENGVVLCQQHHDQAHQMRSAESEAWLRIHADKTLRALGRS